MDAQRFDAVARTLAAGTSRRRVLGTLARGVAGGALALLAGARVDAQPGCRTEGHPCEGNQTCCAGITCAASGSGAASRCTAEATAGECPGDCPVVQVGAEVEVEADCAFAADANETTCTFTAAVGEVEVVSVAVPESQLCAEVVGGDFEEVDLGANARPKGKAKGFKSKKAEGGRPVVTLVLAGEVTADATATYWCETGEAVLIPVAGPGLSCAQAEAPPADDISDSTGAVVVQTYACDEAADAADVDWFDTCDVPTAAANFRLARAEGDTWVEVESQPSDAEGLCRFGQLPPGTYRLEQTEGVWCHAESDGVDERGDVVVKAGARTTVWVFHCAAAK